jgi:hypothetical protein
MAEQNAPSVNISGGAIGGVSISNTVINSLSAPLSINNGGTSATSAQQARTNLLPFQAGSNGLVLTTTGTDVFWGTVNLALTEGILPIAAGGTGAVSAAQAARNILPSYIGQAGKVLSNDSTNLVWQDSAVPSQLGNANRYLFTNGTTTSWNVLEPGFLNGAVPLNKGGTGVAAGNRDVAINALLPSQVGQANKVLTSNGTNVTWSGVNVTGATGVLPLSAGGTGATTQLGAQNTILPFQGGTNFGWFLQAQGSAGCRWQPLPAGNFSVVTYGNSVFTNGFSNQVGTFNDELNYFDVFPPAGKFMFNLIAFLPSIAYIYFAGGVDANDALRCTFTILPDRVRTWVQNTEQRATPRGNYLAFWS